jgi:hypothetical protein
MTAPGHGKRNFLVTRQIGVPWWTRRVRRIVEGGREHKDRFPTRLILSSSKIPFIENNMSLFAREKVTQFYAPKSQCWNI